MSEIMDFSDIASNPESVAKDFATRKQEIANAAEQKKINPDGFQEINSEIFSISRVQCEFKGRLVRMVVRNNILLLALHTLRILRIDVLKPQIIEDIDVPKKGDDSVSNLFLDPLGRHCIITLQSGDVFYHYYTWKKAKPLSKLKSIGITSVEWTSTTVDITRSGSSGPILLGTRSGKLYEAELEPSEEYFRREERYLKELTTLPDSRSGINGILMGKFQDSISVKAQKSKYYVVCTTENRIYQFVGSLTAQFKGESIFDTFFKWNNTQDLVYQELPGELPSSMLKVHLAQQIPKSLAWLTAPGIYHADINSLKSDSRSVLDNVHIMPLPADVVGAESDAIRVIAPISIGLSQFHFLLLYRDRLKAVSKLNDELVFEKQLPPELVTEGCLFAIDDIRSTYWIYSESCFYELVISDEDKDVWQIYLKKLQFDLALEHAKTPVQRDKVLIAQADYYFLQERFLLSASLYGQSNASFERILLKFFGLRDRKMSNGKLVSERMFQEATQRLLSEKFKRIKKTNIIQRQVISALLLDLKLVEYKNAADDKQETAALESIDSWIKSEDLRVLESTVAYQLFSSHGLFDKMIEYASTIGDYDKVMNHYVERKDWTNAVNTLAKQNSDKIVYKYFPSLLRNAPAETVKFLLRNPQLNLHELIRGILGSDSTSAVDLNTQAHAIRFLEHRVLTEGNRDPAVHNFLISLYVLQNNPDYTEKLIKFLKSSERRADLQYALRMCNQWQLYDACIVIYGELRLYDEAVDTALKLKDLELAEIYANKASDDEVMKKRLWMRIARHIMSSSTNIKDSLKSIRNSNAVTIEDVLLYLPDNVVVEDIRDDLVSNLKSYQQKIEQIKMNMTEATQSAKEMRKDIASLKKRFVKISSQDKCMLCRIPLMTAPFYCFYCGHYFHRKCLMAYMVENYLTVPMQQRVFQLDRELKLEAEKIVQTKKAHKKFEITKEFVRLKEEFDEIVSSDCIECGSILAKSIDKPFILPVDEDQAARWKT